LDERWRFTGYECALLLFVVYLTTLKEFKSDFYHINPVVTEQKVEIYGMKGGGLQENFPQRWRDFY
jgi:hypothetical protein